MISKDTLKYWVQGNLITENMLLFFIIGLYTFGLGFFIGKM